MHESSLPAVLTCEKGLNEPRYPSLKGIMMAKKKPLETRDAASVGLDDAHPEVAAELASPFRVVGGVDHARDRGGRDCRAP